MVILVENGHNDQSSNPGEGCLHFTEWTLMKSMCNSVNDKINPSSTKLIDIISLTWVKSLLKNIKSYSIFYCKK